MRRSTFFILLFFLGLGPVLSCRDAPPPQETVFDMPLPPESELFKEVRKGQIKIYKTGLSQEKTVDFYKNHFEEKKASFFKKRGADVVMVAGNETRVIEILTQDNRTLVSFSKFEQ